jgi:hypothetical protein
MTPLAAACRILTHARHCGPDYDWCVAYDGSGPHALGIHTAGPGRRPTILLAAADAIRLAAEYEAAPCESPSSP